MQTPKRRAALVLCLALALAACSSEEPAATTTPAPPEDARANILFVMTDDQGVGDGSLERMPKLQDRLVDEGTSFSHAYPTTNQCCPSRASILRGQHAHSHGVWDNDGSRGGFDSFQVAGLAQSTAATWLDGAGYRTGYVGKYLNGYGDPATPRHVPPGWDAWHGRTGGNGGSTYTVNVNGDLKTVDRSAFHETDYYAKTAERFVRAGGGPWMLTVAPSDPHNPFHAAARHRDMFRNAEMPRAPSFNEADFSDKPPSMRDMTRLGPEGVSRVEGDWRERMRSLQSVDDLVGRLYWALKDTGQLDNTYIVFTSDNGYALNRNRVNSKAPYYDGAARVPFVVRGPGVPADQTRDELAANVDLAPTFADLAGAEAPGFVEGRSLVPLLSAAPGERPPWRDVMLQEYNGDSLEYYAVRTAEGEIYAERPRTGEREHYRADDPHQLQNNYAETDPARIAVLSGRLDALRSCSGAGCREADGGP